MEQTRWLSFEDDHASDSSLFGLLNGMNDFGAIISWTGQVSTVPPNCDNSLGKSQSLANVKAAVVEHVAPNPLPGNRRHEQQSGEPAATTPLRYVPPLISARNLDSLWRGSPIRLLTSQIQLEMRCDHTLNQTYHAVLTGTLCRYMSYRSNLFAVAHPYVIESSDGRENNPPVYDPTPIQHTMGDCISRSDVASPRPGIQGTQNRSASTSSIEKGSDLGILMSQSQPRTNAVTIIGAARFLDNFGPLYGNHLDRFNREEAEDAVRHVSWAMALQCSLSDSWNAPPFSDERIKCSDMFRVAWLRAQSQLEALKGTPSFVYIYAVCLFHMTPLPDTGNYDSDSRNGPVGLLDNALRQLIYLQILVESYCGQLDNSSFYRNITQSSLEILRWCAYMRDTIASLLVERNLVLDDACMPKLSWKMPIRPLECGISLLEGEILGVCQQASALLFILFRKSARLRSLIIRIHTIEDAVLVESIQACTDIIDNFSATYDYWLKQCTATFENLSNLSKLSTAFLVMFWNLGVLCVVEQMTTVRAHVVHGLSTALEGMIPKYQIPALSSLNLACRKIRETSSEGFFKLWKDRSIALPFVSYHANTNLTVAALVKAIEHCIDLKSSTERRVLTHSLAEDILMKEAEKQRSTLRSLLWCLSTFDLTVGGRCAARPALKVLMQRYGDLLMDCWSFDDVD